MASSGEIQATGTQAGRVEVAGARAGALRPRALPTGLGRKTIGRTRWAGPNLLGHQVSGPQVSLCFPFLFLSVFYFLQLVRFSKNAKPLCKMLKIFVALGKLFPTALKCFQDYLDI